MRVLAGLGVVGALVAFAPATAIADPPAARPTSTATAGRWLLDGSGADATEQHHDAVVAGGSWTVGANGKSPGAYKLNGKSQITIADYGGAFELPRFTIAVRVKPDFTARAGAALTINGRLCRLLPVVKKGTGAEWSYRLQIGHCDGSSFGCAIVEVRGADGQVGTAGQAFDLGSKATCAVKWNDWTEISATADGTTLKLLVDGVEKASATSPLAGPATGGIVIGAPTAPASADGFAGAIDDLEITHPVPLTVIVQ